MSDNIDTKPVAEVRCWAEWLGGEKPRQMYELIQFEGFRKLPIGTHPLYTLPATQWRDIATAPKDGTNVLVVADTGHVWMAKWVVRPRAGARWESIGLGALLFQPTHWMPLPAPPVSRQEWMMCSIPDVDNLIAEFRASVTCRIEKRDGGVIVGNGMLLCAADELTRLRAECERLREDAERYQHLKQHYVSETEADDGTLCLHYECSFEHYDNLDASIDDSIDAARSKEQG